MIKTFVPFFLTLVAVLAGPAAAGTGVIRPEMGNPPWNAPRAVSAAEADFMADQELVLGVQIDGASRAYPISALLYHHVCNDTIAGHPICVTF